MGAPQKGGSEMNTDIIRTTNRTCSGKAGMPGRIFDDSELSALKKDITIIAERNISRLQAKNVMMGSPKYSQSPIGWRVTTIPEAEADFDLLVNEIYDDLGLP